MPCVASPVFHLEQVVLCVVLLPLQSSSGSLAHGGAEKPSERRKRAVCSAARVLGGDGGMSAQGVGLRLRSRIVSGMFRKEPHLRERVQGSCCVVVMLHRAVPVRVLGQLALDSACALEFLMVWSARVGGFADAASQGGVRQQHLLFPTCHAQSAPTSYSAATGGPGRLRARWSNGRPTPPENLRCLRSMRSAGGVAEARARASGRKKEAASASRRPPTSSLKTTRRHLPPLSSLGIALPACAPRTAGPGWVSVPKTRPTQHNVDGKLGTMPEREGVAYDLDAPTRWPARSERLGRRGCQDVAHAAWRSPYSWRGPAEQAHDGTRAKRGWIHSRRQAEP